MTQVRSLTDQNAVACENAVRNSPLGNTGGCAAAAVPPPCNVLFYSCMEIQNDRFCMLQRPYIAFSLAERLATRPHWSMVNRLFASYQLLHGILQLHEVWGTVHGDLKSDNVLVNTSGWLYITDLCPFNPALLPANNPALFNYFYDTNESHICSLAPEKFVDHATHVNTSNLNATGHTPGMDVFSAACVIAYIFSEEPLFRLSEVLELRSLQSQREREAMVDNILQERGLAPNICRMLMDMLCTDPSCRPTARQILERSTPAVFPPYFEYLHRDVFTALLPRPPEHQVQLLWSSLEDIFTEVEMRSECNGPAGEPADSASPPLLAPYEAKKATVLVLIPIIINAGLHLMASEAHCRVMSVVQRILPYCPADIQSDVILPYILHCVRTEGTPVVARVLALRVLSTISHAIPFTTGDATLFDDLILPCMEGVVAKADTQNVTLLLEVANQLPSLLLLARSFLEQQQALVTANEQQTAYGGQLNRLLERGWDALRTLYKHTHSAVVIAALQRSVDVVKFLGEERTQHDFIPFLTTAISSTIDVQRELYPQAILCHVTLQCPPMKTLRFFVEEALRRPDTIILQRAIQSMSVVAASKSVGVDDVTSLVLLVLPHMLNRNMWVSLAARQLLETVAQTYSVSDVCTRLPKALIPLLKHRVPLSTVESLPPKLMEEITLHTSSFHWPVDERAAPRIIGGDSTFCRRVAKDVGWCVWENAGRDPTKNSMGKLGQCQSRYILRHGVPKRFPQNFSQRAAFFDASFDQSVMTDTASVQPIAAAVNSRDAVHEKDHVVAPRVWTLTLKPTPRERRRLVLRQRMYANCSNSGSYVGCGSSVLYATVNSPYACLPLSGSPSSRNEQPPAALCPNVTWADKELRPVAAPYFTQRAHTGAIYSSSAAGGGVLVTAGGKGEALLWSVTASGVNLSSRLNVGEVTGTCAFLFAHFARGETSPLVCLGGTDGTWRLCDLTSNEPLQEQNFDGSPLTAACALSEGVMLVSSALGSLFAVDYRVGREVWRGSGMVPADFGTVSGISPLCSDYQAYGAAVATVRGGVVLFDLRFQTLLQKHWLHSADSQGSCSFDSPVAILCVSPDAACRPAHQLNEHPGLLLGTRSGVIYHIDLLSGRSCVSLRPATPNCPTRTMLLQPKHRLLFTAGDDMQIRKWCLSNSARSSTVVCPPYSSHAYARRNSGSTMEITASSKLSGKEVAPGAASPHATSDTSLFRVVVPQHHSDAILTLCAVSENGGSEVYLASGSRDGRLTLWFNAE